MNYLVDTHSHLYDEKFGEDRAEVIARAAEAGVRYHFLPNIDLDSVLEMIQLMHDFPDQCFPMLGLHPCSVDAGYKDVLSVIKDKIDHAAALLGKPIVAIGEIGLDFHWDITYREQQVLALQEQIDWALELQLPIVLHTRKSVQETIHIVKAKQNGQLSGVFHCFGGSVQEAMRVIDLGNFFLGIGGVATYKNAGMADVVQAIPLEFLILETDAPYLAPVPHRGKRNEPAFMRFVAEKVAEIKGISLEEVAEVTTNNAARLYNVALT